MDELQIIQSKIYVIRGLRVMLDFDLAILYVHLIKPSNVMQDAFPTILCSNSQNKNGY